MSEPKIKLPVDITSGNIDDDSTLIQDPPIDPSQIKVPGASPNPPSNTPPNPTSEKPLFEEGAIVTIGDVDYVIRNSNAVKEDGTIFKTKDELIALASQEKQIEIDNVRYTLNEKGDAVNTDGQVFMTKAQIDALSAKSAPVGKIDDIIEAIGFKPMLGNRPVPFDNTIEGISNYIQTYAKEVEVATKERTLNSLYDSYPVIPRLINHLEANGSLEGFNINVDPNIYKVTDNDENSITKVILHGLALKGIDPETAQSVYESKKKEGKALEFAKTLETFRGNHYASLDKANKDAIESTRQEEVESHNKYWGVSVNEDGTYVPIKEPNSIYHKIVNEGKLTVNGEAFKIPNNITVVDPSGKPVSMDRQEFFEFMFIPEEIKLQDGTSVYYTPFEIMKMQQDAKRTTDHDILDAFKILTGSVSQLVSEKKLKHTLGANVVRLSTEGTPTNNKPRIILPVNFKD